MILYRNLIFLAAIHLYFWQQYMYKYICIAAKNIRLRYSIMIFETIIEMLIFGCICQDVVQNLINVLHTSLFYLLLHIHVHSGTYKIRQIRKTRFTKLSILVYWYIQNPILYHDIELSIFWYIDIRGFDKFWSMGQIGSIMVSVCTIGNTS